MDVMQVYIPAAIGHSFSSMKNQSQKVDLVSSFSHRFPTCFLCIHKRLLRARDDRVSKGHTFMNNGAHCVTRGEFKNASAIERSLY